ncbi:OLC1v1021327C1 [Oldenlandia corymbosa var. corymbosa]|uniref:OLC1v1021327C1 n=1 Tax=Oldenlandia corymbosa var. corymbosa TaxID=529605 RepID=A0AAV1BVN9_OLDCO|nr:OLC1v1021327C1 [Oldenlandia corymbosa var. corymbosa]
MDSGAVHLVAIEEICAAGPDGLNLLSLWGLLQSPLATHGLPLCPNVKAALWSSLLNFPGLQFRAQGNAYDPQDSSIQSVQKCEQLNLKIIASERLRDEFLGIYDVHASSSAIEAKQRSVLERVAMARSNGITQSELAKELKIKGNNIFYILKKLETRGLIVRQSTVVKTKEATREGEHKNSCMVATNMVFLYRYAKHLGCQQRIEIVREDKPFYDKCDNGGVSGANDVGFRQDHVEEDVQVRDFLPALEAICDKLEKADRKVLVVSDIKRDLGYRDKFGHRAWRRIYEKLRAAGLVEDCATEVRGKKVKCLRLLKKFSPKYFEPNSSKHGNDELEQEQQKLGKRAQITDQLVELPIEHQIYDMIDKEGCRGLTITEIYCRLGLRHKQYYERILEMSARFGVHFQAESRDRGVAYRVWTSRNFRPEVPHLVPCDPKAVSSEITECGPCPLVWEADNSNPLIQDVDASASKDVKAAVGTVIEAEISFDSTATDDSNLVLLPMSTTEASVEVPNVELHTDTTILDAGQCETSSRRRRSYREYPCLTLDATKALREKRILEMLEAEKILIKPDLHWRLNDLEKRDKEKASLMASKTLQRRLSKLQQEGRCKCISLNIPVITNCSEKRKIEVVLHPSISIESPEVVDQIHEKARFFEIQTRRKSHSELREITVPVLDGVERIPLSVPLDSQAEQAEARRNNGFVLSKIVRAKLLHGFLWDYISGSPGWSDLLSIEENRHNFIDPHGTSKLFRLDVAIKAMPLELFLQVVGSTQKFEDMIDKCKNGLRLSDLSLPEYRCLMNTVATAGLSRLIDILQRLKLIRLVRAGRMDDEEKLEDTTLTHALELKPYMEEPVAIASSSFRFIFPDLRPHIRHDFILSSRKAVDEYWSTLEYCYSTANSNAALHAFPGSAVPEVFGPRSWASARVMTSDQRAELLKRLALYEPHIKLSFNECRQISRDLNLTQEQVLRIYHDRRQKRIRLSGDAHAKDPVIETLSRTCSSSRRRKRPLARNFSKRIAFANNDQLTDRQTSFIQTLRDHDNGVPQDAGGDQMHTTEEQEPNEESEHDQSVMDNCTVLNLNPGRKRRFSWTEEAERQLLIEYVRHRAAHGANYHRTDWASIKNLPAPPEICRRRMALLNENLQFRKAAMRLCNMLAERYAKKLEKFQNHMLNLKSTGVLVREPIQGDCDENVSDPFEDTLESGSEECWDNFEDSDLKMALDDVLRFRRVGKFDSSSLVGSDELYAGQESYCPEDEAFRMRKLSAQRLRCRHIVQKYNKLSKESTGIGRRVYESVAVSNAAELFKLIFLSTSISPEASKLLAETLRHYSQHDLFAAFSYLRENKIMIGGDGTTPFSLSQEFLHSISLSPFPTNTGKKALKFSCWLAERENDLMEGGLGLPTDLQCGDIFHLCALVSKAELSITPCLPETGIGEAEDSRTSKLHSYSSEDCGGDRSKRLRTSMAGDGEVISRREKGFPGIRLSLSLSLVPRIDTLDVFKDNENSCLSVTCERGETNPLEMQIGSDPYQPVACDPARMEVDNCDITQTAAPTDTSPWEAMTSYAMHLYSSLSREGSSPFHPELFRTVCSALQTSGDRGLSMKEVSKILSLSGPKESEIIVDVLEAFGRAFKVCAYDSIHVMDILYRPKYLLSSASEAIQIHGRNPPEVSEGKSDAFNRDVEGSRLQDDMRINSGDIHRVTILNRPKEFLEVSSDAQSATELVNDTPTELSVRANPSVRIDELHSFDSHLFKPILPWINGDGTVNELVYKGLVRRILGIVMQNPGILEDDIVKHMRALNPQNCRKLLAKLILDNHIIVRRMQQASVGPSVLLGGTFGICSRKPKVICRKHLFANPMSGAFL